MKGKIFAGVTPQSKMVAVNNRFGNKNIASQQGTTRVLFDSIEYTGNNAEYRFFENAGSKQYPYTNIGAEGNRLNVGDTFVVQKIYFGIMQTDDLGAIIDFLPGLVGINGIFKGEFNFQIANSQVIKQLPLAMFSFPSCNSTAVNSQDLAFETFTDIVIPPLLEYVANVRFASSGALPPAGNYRIVCFLEGSAGIIAPQTTF